MEVETTHRSLLNRNADIKVELDSLMRKADKEPLDASDEKLFLALTSEFKENDELRKKMERESQMAVITEAMKNPAHMIAGDPSDKEMDSDPLGEPRSIKEGRTFKDPWNMSEIRTFGKTPREMGTELRARALSAIEQMAGASDAVRQTSANILDRWDSKDGKIAQHVLATSSPAYMRAFAKLAKNQTNLLDEEERQAVDRAMSLTDGSGGYLIPFQLDPTVIITTDGTYNQIRQAARTVIATGDVWNGVSAGATAWSWDGEAAQVSDDASTFVQPTISIWKAQGFVPISIEALADEQNVTAEVARLIAFGKDDLEGAAFATGSGSSQPIGIITALVASSPTVIVSATTDDSLGLEDIYALDGDLPARYRSRASWLAHRNTYNAIRQFDTAGGAALWERLGADVPNVLLGRPAYETEGMDGVIDGSSTNYVAVFGDFSNYVIADRIGTTVEFIPHLFGTNHRPTGERGWYAYYRVGADSVNDGAFRLLDV